MPTLRAGDLELHYDRRGDGPRLLFISGTGSDLRNTPNVLDGPLPKHFDTLAYDHRGLGRSAKLDHPVTMADYANDAANLLRAVGWDNALVIGVSFGGMVAQELAIRHPRAVTRLVLACTSPGGRGGASYPLHTLEHLTRDERARHMIPISDLRRDAAWAAAQPQKYAQQLALASADPFADEPGHETGRRRQLEARAQHDTWDRLPRIACPTLICAGKYDGIATPEAQQNMAAQIAGAQLRFFEGGHLFMLQDRTAYPAMIDFLAESG
jgi:3-oxoadipate enol-lactonase